jgi:preprotein translocase subunit SecG
MYPLVLAIHVLVCLLVVLIVLLQSGKGAGFSGMFGGGSDALFNAPSGSMFIRKLTTGLAAGFFITSLLLTYLAAHERSYTVTRSYPAAQSPAPAGEIPAGAPSAPSGAQVPAAPVKVPAPTDKK